MKSTASAPGKIILFGEHFVVYGIKAILCSIDRRITATSEFLDEKVVRITSSLGSAEVSTESLDNLDKLPQKFMKPFFHIAKNAFEENSYGKGLNITIKSDIPHGVGLGSSSASCIAVTASVNQLFKKLTREEVMQKLIEAERTIFQQSSGADTAVSTFGGLMLYDLKNGFHNIPVKNRLSFIIANSSQTHDTNSVVNQVRKFKEKNEALFKKMCEKEDQILSQATLAINQNDQIKIGALMMENHALLKEIGVSTDKIELLIKTAQKTSLGAKITGAGGGGCIIALVNDSSKAETLSNLSDISDCFIANIDYHGLDYS